MIRKKCVAFWRWIRELGASIRRPEWFIIAFIVVLTLSSWAIRYNQNGSDIAAAFLGNPIPLAVDFFAWFMFWSAPIFLFGRFSRFLYCPLLVVWLTLDVIIVFAKVNFAMEIDGALMDIIRESSLAEVGNFIRLYFSIGLVLLFAVYLFLIYVIIYCSTHIRAVSLKRFMVGVAILSIALVIGVRMDLFYYQDIIRNSAEDIPEYRLVADCIRYQSILDLEDKDELPSEVFVAPNKVPSVGVFVLGESATRNHWGSYGYSRMTTPCIQDRGNEIVFFSDCIAAASYTAGSMRYLFTQATLDDDNSFARSTMSMTLKHCGVNTAFFSNQERWGRRCLARYAFSGCDPMMFAQELGLDPHYDDCLVPLLKRELEKSGSSNSVCFVQFSGSHLPASIQYPHGQEPYKGDTEYDHYDNSIWFSDKVIGSIIDLCDGLDKPSWVVYISDHGESPDSGKFRDTSDNSVWEVPFIIWFSEEYRKLNPEIVAQVAAAKNRPLQSDQLFAGILRLSGVNAGADSEVFYSPEFHCRPVRKLTGGRIYSRGRAK